MPLQIEALGSKAGTSARAELSAVNELDPPEPPQATDTAENT